MAMKYISLALKNDCFSFTRTCWKFLNYLLHVEGQARDHQERRMREWSSRFAGLQYVYVYVSVYTQVIHTTLFVIPVYPWSSRMEDTIINVLMTSSLLFIPSMEKEYVYILSLTLVILHFSEPLLSCTLLSSSQCSILSLSLSLSTLCQHCLIRLVAESVVTRKPPVDVATRHKNYPLECGINSLNCVDKSTYVKLI